MLCRVVVMSQPAGVLPMICWHKLSGHKVFRNEFFFFKESHYVAMTILELSVDHSGLELTQKSPCLCLLSGRIKGVYYHTWKKRFFFLNSCTHGLPWLCVLY